MAHLMAWDCHVRLGDLCWWLFLVVYGRVSRDSLFLSFSCCWPDGSFPCLTSTGSKLGKPAIMAALDCAFTSTATATSHFTSPTSIDGPRATAADQFDQR